MVGLALTWVVAALIPASRTRDAAALDGFTHLAHPRIEALAYQVAQWADPTTCLLLGTLLIGVALLAGRTRVAVAVPVVLLGSALTSQLLKPLVAHAHDTATLGAHEIPAASWPSGHSTAAMALALCAVMVAPKRLRPMAAGLGAVFAVSVSFSLLVLARHMPSDVVGGFLVAALWISLALVALRGADRRWPTGTARRKLWRAGNALQARRASHWPDRRLPGVCAAIALGLVAVLVALRFPAVSGYTSTHPTLAVAASAIATLAVALAASLALAVRRF